jgi:hypothetical protein
VAPGTGGISVRGGRSWAIWRAVQAVQVGFGENEGGEMGTIVRHGLHTIADPIVADSRTQLLLLWLQASSSTVKVLLPGR